MSLGGNSSLASSGAGLGEVAHLTNGHTYGTGDQPVSPHFQSPYTDTKICILEVGSQKTPFGVHRTILAQSPRLAVKQSSMLWGEKTSNDAISLPELEVSTAHTLIHYLYSGRYQTLRPGNLIKISGYKDSTCVYCAAIRYELPGLAELAKDKISSHGEELTILELLKVARDYAFPNLPERDVWFPKYLEDAIKSAGLQDPTLFMSSAFIDQIEGDRRFRQVVMQAIVNTVSVKGGVPSERSITSSTPDTVLTKSTATSLQDVSTLDTLEKFKPTSGGTADVNKVQTPSQVAPKAESIAASISRDPYKSPVIANGSDVQPTRAESTSVDQDLKLDDIDPTPSTTSKLEPFTDELGFKSSKTYQQISSRPDKHTEAESKNAAPVPTAVHKRTDSVLESPPKQVPQADKAPEAPKELVAKADQTVDEVPATINTSEQDAKSAAKKKKGKKGKKGTGF